MPIRLEQIASVPWAKTFFLNSLTSSASTWKPPYFVSEDTEPGRECLWFKLRYVNFWLRLQYTRLNICIFNFALNLCSRTVALKQKLHFTVSPERNNIPAISRTCIKLSDWMTVTVPPFYPPIGKGSMLPFVINYYKCCCSYPGTANTSNSVIWTRLFWA